MGTKVLCFFPEAERPGGCNLFASLDSLGGYF